MQEGEEGNDKAEDGDKSSEPQIFVWLDLVAAPQNVSTHAHIQHLLQPCLARLSNRPCVGIVATRLHVCPQSLLNSTSGLCTRGMLTCMKHDPGLVHVLPASAGLGAACARPEDRTCHNLWPACGVDRCGWGARGTQHALWHTI